MKKNENKTSKFICIVLLLCIIAMILVAGTYAKYVSKATGSATATVAKWDVYYNDQQLTYDNSNVNFTLFADDELLYPGKTGTFNFKLQNKSEVAATYGIDFEVNGTENLPIEFSLTGADGSWTADLSDATGTLPAGQTAATTVTGYWRWNPTNGDEADTLLGVEAANATKNVEVSATLTVEQAQ